MEILYLGKNAVANGSNAVQQSLFKLFDKLFNSKLTTNKEDNSKADKKDDTKNVIEHNSLVKQGIKAWQNIANQLIPLDHFIPSYKADYSTLTVSLKGLNGLRLDCPIVFDYLHKFDDKWGKKAIYGLILSQLAEEISTGLGDLMTAETNNYDFQDQYHVNTADKVRKLHLDEDDFITLGRVVFLASLRKENYDHLCHSKRVGVLSMSENQKKRLIKAYKEVCKMYGFAYIEPRILRMTDLDGTKGIKYVTLYFQRPDGLERIGLTIWTSDVRHTLSGNEKLLIKNVVDQIKYFNVKTAYRRDGAKLMQLRNLDEMAVKSSLVADGQFFESVRKLYAAIKL